jgi:hypothetical protein
MSQNGFDPTISLLVQSETLRHELRSSRAEPLTCCCVQLDFRLLVYTFLLVVIRTVTADIELLAAQAVCLLSCSSVYMPYIKGLVYAQY